MGDAGSSTGHEAGASRAALLAEILEASNDLVVTTDPDGWIVDANRAFRERFGIEDFGPGRHRLVDLYAPEFREQFVAEGIGELLRRGRWSGQVEALLPDGDRLVLWQSAIVHRWPDGTIRAYSGIAYDITARTIADERLHAAEERFRALIARSTDVVLVIDTEGQFSFVGPNVQNVMGYRPEELLGTRSFDLVHPDDLPAVLDSLGEILAGTAPGTGLHYRVRHADGTWRWIESFTTDHTTTPGVDGLIVNARDVTARYQAAEDHRRAASLLSSVMRAATTEAIIVTDRDARIVAFSRGAERLLGYSADEVVGLVHPAIFHLRHEIDATAAEVGVEGLDLWNYEPPTGTVVREWTFVRKDGSTFIGSLTVTARHHDDGTLAGFLYLVSDITERLRTEADLVHRAETDHLTGLANRGTLERSLARAEATPGWFQPGRTVLFIDLDHFKDVNDSFGHATGDDALVEVAHRIRDHLRTDDIAARWGGDEFVVLLHENVTAEQARSIAQRIVDGVAEPVELTSGVPAADRTIRLGASIGVATSRRGTTPMELIAAADGAAYAAKQHGRGCVVTAD